MTRVLGRALLASALIALAVAASACLPYEARRLNTAGDKAMAERRYEQAISSYSRSLSIAPDQEKVRNRLSSAKVLLRQIYVDRIYDLVDSRAGKAPTKEFVNAWELSSRLAQVDVTAARVASIHQDLSRRFSKAEPRLRGATERHRYFMALNRMEALVRDRAVADAIIEVGDLLRASHLKARARADRRRKRGLALLHCAAAATFSTKDTGLWNEVRRRRKAILARLGISIQLNVKAARATSGRYLGGVRRRLPSIFKVKGKAPLTLSLEVRKPDLEQRETRSRLSADCKVGTRRVDNPECPSLKRRAEQERRDLESARKALDAASARCAQEAQASSCTSHISDAEGRLRRQRDDYRRVESQVSSCPRHIEKPVFKTFFYQRRTIGRRATVSAALTLNRRGTAINSRAVHGTAAASDTYGDGLGCARIPSDPLQLPSLASLQVAAEERMLNDSLKELWQLQREKSIAQLAGGDKEADRLDALVRARLVDPTYKRVTGQLQRHLASMWGADFKLTETTFK